MFGPKKEEVSIIGYYTIRNFVFYTDHILLLEQCKLGGYSGLKMWLEWEVKECIEILVWKCQLRTSKMKCVDKTKMYLNEIGCEDGRWMELAQDCAQW
jgi:hypothetical protein